MQALRGFAWLLALQTLGELLSRALRLPFPGPVVGMLLLLLALALPAVREPVSQCADFLLSHLSLLFVPAGVGVMQHFDRVTGEWLPIAVALVFSTVLALAATALVMRWLLARQERRDAVREAA